MAASGTECPSGLEESWEPVGSSSASGLGGGSASGPSPAMGGSAAGPAAPKGATRGLKGFPFPGSKLTFEQAACAREGHPHPARQ
eukprot:3821605-Prorocentrum_lima.AAC.1